MISHVDVRDLIDHPGAAREVHLAEPVGPVETPVAEVPADAPVAVDVLLESVVEGILVSGRVAGTVAFRCARCLTDFERDVAAEVRELFTRAAEAEDAEAEYPLGPEGYLDLVPMVRDAIVLDLPFSPLCRPDCLGLCPRCGGNRNLGECTCGPDADPRWAGLAELEAMLQDGGSGGVARPVESSDSPRSASEPSRQQQTGPDDPR